jgi:tRNA dimethylallyltransferase
MKISKLPILVGPTGVGKSEIAFLLAKQLKAEILSADAFQVYKGLEVGTAQPSQVWQRLITHHLVGVRDPRQSWSAVEFAKHAKKIIEAAQQRERLLVLVGGSGFYIKALVEGPPQGEAPKPEIRKWVTEKIREFGPGQAHAWLGARDVAAAKRLHPNDLQRICRALEKTFETSQPEGSFDSLGTSAVLFLGFERSRDKLDEILRARTRSMWKNGLLDEAKRLMEMNLSQDHPVLKAIGYQEAIGFLENELTEEEAVDRIFHRTRQYAKRQWTWFRHQHEVHWFNLDGFSKLSDLIDLLVEKIANEK